MLGASMDILQVFMTIIVLMKNYDNEEQIFYAANAVSGSGFYKFENN